MKHRNDILAVVLTCILLLSACAPAVSVQVATETIVPEPTAPQTPEPTSTPKSIPSPTDSSLPGRQGLIAYFTTGGIAIIPADGSGEPVQLSSHPTSDSKPAWSPDGSQIAFDSLRDDPVDQQFMDIYIMNVDGSHLTKVTNTDGSYMHPDWSPDGTQIVMSAVLDGIYDLYILDLDTKKLINLTDDPAVDADPSWSPDGTRIAFGSVRNDSANIYTIDLDSGEITQLTRESGRNLQPDWSPDGKKILFTSNRDGDVELYMMDADGANQQRLTNSPGKDMHSSWSPDGKFIAYTHEDAESGTIHVMDLLTSKDEVLVDHPDHYAGYPAWSPAAVEISRKPMFGGPFCMKDTNGDFEPDQATNTFTTADSFPYVAFPYRNMSPDLSWSYTLDYEKSSMDSMNMALAWKHGESGWFVSSPTGATLSMVGEDKVRVKLYIEQELIQEITCEVIEE